MELFLLIGGILLLSASKKAKEQKEQPQKQGNLIAQNARFKDPKHNAFVENLAKELAIPAGWLFGLMYFETAKTLSPQSKVNCPGYGQNSRYNFCCGGLIGFCPVYSPKYDTYIDGSKVYQKGNILEQGIDYQLKYVRKFFLDGVRNFGRIKSKLDCYLMVFNPMSIKYSSNPNHIVGSKGDGNAESIKAMNPAFRDEKANGYVTIRKINEVINQWF